MRVIDLPEVPQRGLNYITGRPPFTQEAELRLFRQLRIDWLLTKNSGGAAGLPKLAAARALGLPVAMVQRPLAAGPAVASVDAALTWLEALE